MGQILKINFIDLWCTFQSSVKFGGTIISLHLLTLKPSQCGEELLVAAKFGSQRIRRSLLSLKIYRDELYLCCKCSHQVPLFCLFQRGQNHRSRVMDLNSDLVLGYIKALPEYEVAQVPNDAPTRGKVPLRLQVKLMTAATPIVGLEFVDEFLPESSDDVEPYYEVRKFGPRALLNFQRGAILNIFCLLLLQLDHQVSQRNVEKFWSEI